MIHVHCSKHVHLIYIQNDYPIRFIISEQSLCNTVSHTEKKHSLRKSGQMATRHYKEKMDHVSKFLLLKTKDKRQVKYSLLTVRIAEKLKKKTLATRKICTFRNVKERFQMTNQNRPKALIFGTKI